MVQEVFDANYDVKDCDPVAVRKGQETAVAPPSSEQTKETSQL